jgi:Tfp pilus assembly protein PilO
MAKPLSGKGLTFSLRPTKKVCTGMGVAMAGILLGCVGLWFWQDGDLEAKAKVIHSKVDQVENGERVARRLDEVKTDYQANLSKLRFLENSVSPGAFVPTMLDQIAEIAKSEKLEIVRFAPNFEPAPKPPTTPEARKTFKPQPYDMWHVDMQVKGTYWAATRFINKLTQFKKIVAQDSVQLAPLAAVVGESPQLNATLKFTAFAFHDDTKPASLATMTPVTRGGAGTARRNMENQVISGTSGK